MKRKTRKRVPVMKVIESSAEIIHSQEFLDSARKRPQDFTRKRNMPFTDLIHFMINMLKSSIQTCLDHYLEMTEKFRDSAKIELHMSQQAFSEARQKIKWEAFRELFLAIVNVIYTGFYETWHGYRVSAIDGSKTQLPDEQKLKDHFGTMGKNLEAAMGQASALYDVLNNVLIDTQLAPLKTGERVLASRHIDVLCSLPSFGKECVLFDRGYASFVSIETLKERKVSFVFRVKKGFNKSIDLLNTGDHNVTLHKKGHDDIPVRILKFTLPSGEVETLLTDITDKRMGVEAFKKLYFKRWPIETKYDEIKNKLEVENFSGRTVNAIMQDFFITMYMSNVLSVASWEAQSVVDDERELKDNKYDYHVNVNHAVGTLKDRFIMALLEPNPRIRRQLVRRILLLLSKHPVPTRPGRSSPRNPSPRKAKFRHNRKSNC